MSGTVLKNFVMFRRLCGDRAAERVRLVTTTWDKVEDARLAENRAAQLETSFWKLLKALARHKRRLNSSRCAWDIIVDLTGKREALQVSQEELVADEETKLNETTASQTPYTPFQKLPHEQEETIKQLQEEAKVQRDLESAKQLEAE
ncbi:hypothetical protein F5141DRAFT_1135062 [Pisolithus sp. B1]|nr:hypothetical protein F5141DRAFT_1135062 [Pisolithus sp. B1]